MGAVTAQGGTSRILVRRVLPALLVALLALVVVADVVLLVIASRYQRFRLLDGAGIRFASSSTVVDLRPLPVEPEMVKVGARHVLIEGWGETVGGGVWIDGARAVIDLDAGLAAPVELVVRARAAGAAPVTLSAAANGQPLGTRSFGRDEPTVGRWPLPRDLHPHTAVRLELGVADRGRPRARVLVVGVALVAAAGVPWPDLVRPPLVLDPDRHTIALRQPGRLRFGLPATAAAHELRLEYRFVGSDGGGWPDGRGTITLHRAGDAVDTVVLDAGLRLHDRVRLPVGRTAGSALLEIALDELTPGAVLVIDDPVVIPGTAFLMAPG